MTRALYWLLMACLFMPVFVGLIGTILPAFHFLPALGRTQFSFQPWHELLSTAGLTSSLMLSLISGMGSTLIAFVLAFTSVALFYTSTTLGLIRSSLAPLLAIPHASLAVGLLFLLSPSGWLVRLFSPWLTGFERPPDWIIVQDPYSLSLILALIIKETPYLIFVLLAALKNHPIDDYLLVGRSMGYHKLQIWHKVIFPIVYPSLRMAIFVVLAFGLTVVDLALVIGPNTPSTFAVTLFRWFNEADLTWRFRAAAGSILLLMMIILCITLWECLMWSFMAIHRRVRINGHRQGWGSILIRLSGQGYLVILTTAISALLLLPLWSIAHRWRFPDSLPSQWSLDALQRLHPLLWTLSLDSLLIACISSGLAVVISVLILQRQSWQPNTTFWFNRLIYLPILLPQVGFLFGLQITLIASGISGSWAAVIAMHFIYVMPYVFLTLHGPYLAFNHQYYLQAILLSKKPFKAFVFVKLALLKAPILSAFAIGVAVSFSQYLPTLVAGEGRITTLTTEVVTLAASGERKKVSSLAMIQALIPLLVFVLAIWLPRAWTPLRLKLVSRARHH